MLLAVGIMFQPMTGMALADTGDASTGAECQLRGTAGFWGGFLGVDVEQCQTPAENVGENHADAYAQALAAEDTGEFGTTNYQNQLQYSRNNCLCKVKAGVIDDLKAGNNISTAKANANETIDEHYSAVQNNVIEQHGSQVTGLYYSADVLRSLGITDTMWSDTEGSVEDFSNNIHMSNPDWAIELTTRTVTLKNGETKNATIMDISGSNDPAGEYRLYPFDPAEAETPNHPDGRQQGVWMYEPGKTDVTHSRTTENATYVYDEQEWANTWDEIDAEEQYVTDNSMTYIEEVYAQYDESDFDDSDAAELRDSCDLQTLATNKDSTGSNDWVRIQGATTGLDSDVNSSFTIEYTPASGETHVGDTSVSADTDALTLENPTLGADAIVTGEETFRVDLNSPGAIESPELVLRNVSDDSIVTSVNLTDTNTDGTYRASLPGADFSTLANGDDVTASVEATADGTDTRVDLGAWTYAPNGGETVTLQGGLYTDWKPTSTNESFVAGTTYDTANADSDVVFIDTSGDDAKQVSMDGTFTIVEMYNPETGETVNETTLEDYNTQTTDASLTQEEVQKILDWKKTYDSNWNPTVSIGGDGGFLSGLSSTLGVGGIIVLGTLGLILYASRSQ
jgi:hypothetical protein